MFQSRNRETFDSNLPCHVLAYKFQSRNRETFDSNQKGSESVAQRSKHARCFNLVIEKLLIPTNGARDTSKDISQFQSRNRETFDSNLKVPARRNSRFQSRNRETFALGTAWRP